MAIRPMSWTETQPVGRVMSRAFNQVFHRHGYPPPFTSERDAVELTQWYLKTEPEGCFVAMVREQTVGAAFLHRRGTTTSIGPVAVDPRYQNLQLGNALMEHMLARIKDCTSIRLFQDAFNTNSFAFYTKMQFRAVDIVPIVIRPMGRKGFLKQQGEFWDESGRVEKVGVARIDDVAEIDSRLTRSNRRQDLKYLLEIGVGFVIHSKGTPSGFLCAYRTRGGVYVGPAAAINESDLFCLLEVVDSYYKDFSVIFRLPGRHTKLLQRLLAERHRLSNLGTLMVRGEWSTPEAAELLAVFPESL